MAEPGSPARGTKRGDASRFLAPEPKGPGHVLALLSLSHGGRIRTDRPARSALGRRKWGAACPAARTRRRSGCEGAPKVKGWGRGGAGVRGQGSAARGRGTDSELVKFALGPPASVEAPRGPSAAPLDLGIEAGLPSLPSPGGTSGSGFQKAWRSGRVTFSLLDLKMRSPEPERTS